MSSLTSCRAIVFDVFGTCVDWKSTVTRAFWVAVDSKLHTYPACESVSDSMKEEVSRITVQRWGDFAQQWRNTYKDFTQSIAKDSSIRWKTIDEHYFDALVELVKEWNIDGFWSIEELRKLSMVWHHLDPWSGAIKGVEMLNHTFETATLSNGNIELLEDLREHSGIKFKHLLSSQVFQSYKPSAKVYLGAVGKLGLQPDECIMVAAHLSDLKAAKSNGLRTIYIEILQEEDYSDENISQSKEEGFVDLWVDLNENGFITVANRLDLTVEYI